MNGTWLSIDKVTTSIVGESKRLTFLLDYNPCFNDDMCRVINFTFVTFACGISSKLYQQKSTKRKTGKGYSIISF